MTRNRRRLFLSLAMAGVVVVAGCDDGTEPRNIGDFDAAEVSAAVQLILEPINAVIEPNFILSTFVYDMLGGSTAATSAGLDGLRSRSGLPFAAEPARALDGALLQSQTPDIPAEMRGKTFVWDPAQEVWVEDPERTGAPAAGVRIVWYDINDFGEILVPLQEMGYIDLTEDDTPGLDRLAVTIVSTDGDTEVTVADYVYGQDVSESGDTWTESVLLAGTFGEGTAALDVDIVGSATGSSVTGDEDYALDMFADGPEGSYRWTLDGALDGATGTSSDDYLITVVRHQAGAASTTTILDLDTAADAQGAMDGTGTLSHAGSAVADITISDSDFSYAPSAGGSFTPGQLADLDELTFYMFFSGPLLLLVLPFVAF